MITVTVNAFGGRLFMNTNLRRPVKSFTAIQASRTALAGLVQMSNPEA